MRKATKAVSIGLVLVSTFAVAYVAGLNAMTADGESLHTRLFDTTVLLDQKNQLDERTRGDQNSIEQALADSGYLSRKLEGIENNDHGEQVITESQADKSGIELISSSDELEEEEIEKHIKNATKTYKVVSGRIASRNDLVIKAEIEGVIKSLHTSLGKPLKQNERIAQIGCLGRESAKAVAQAKHDLDLIDQENKKQLHNQGALHTLEYELAKAQAAISGKELESAKNDLNQCSVRAPSNGVVVELMVMKGQYVQVGDPILRISDKNMLYGVANVHRSYWNKYEAGAKVGMNVIDINSNRQATVFKKSDYINEKQTFLVEFNILDPKGLTSGMIFDLSNE